MKRSLSSGSPAKNTKNAKSAKIASNSSVKKALTLSSSDPLDHQDHDQISDGSISDEDLGPPPPATTVAAAAATTATTGTRPPTFNKQDPLGLNRIKGIFMTRVQEVYDSFNEIGQVPQTVITSFKQIFDQIPDNDEGKRIYFDQVMRDFMLEKTKIIPNRTEKFPLIIDISISLSKENILTSSTPIMLLTDLVELSTLKDCEQTFQIIEQRLAIWKGQFFYNTSGKNYVLRMCNDLLRRLSRSQNTIFYGRILIFLSNYFPFSERSGLNLMSEFNIENVTVYKTGDGSTDDPDDKMEAMDESSDSLFEGIDVGIPGLDKIVNETQEDKKNKMKVDYNLYVKFWSLQDFFRNPVQCYNKIAWKSFTVYLGDVLNAFSFFKIESHSKREEISEADLDFKYDGNTDDLYFAKYLTNRRLLELQMSDVSFRRCFLVQVMIIFQYLQMSVRFKSETSVLSEDQSDFVRKTTDKIYQLMAEIPPDGKRFVEAVKHTLEREKLWNNWKNDRCPAFKKPSDSAGSNPEAEEGEVVGDSGQEARKKITRETMTDEEYELYEDTEQLVLPNVKKRSLGDICQEADSKGRIVFGNPELSKLWNICPDDFEICRSKSRDFMPSVETYFERAMGEIDQSPASLNMTADAYKKEVKPKKILGNSLWGWKAIRLLARKSPYFFQICGSSPITPMQNYIEFILKKIIIDSQLVKEDPTTVEHDKVPNEDLQKEGGPQDEAENPGVVLNEDVDGVEEDEMMCSKKEETSTTSMTNNKDKDKDEEMAGDDNNSEVGGNGGGGSNEKVRNLTSEERNLVGKALAGDIFKLGVKLGFSKDEIEYFEEDFKEDAASYLLKLWTEQEGVDATVADLLYRIEGLGLLPKIEGIFS